MGHSFTSTRAIKWSTTGGVATKYVRDGSHSTLRDENEKVFLGDRELLASDTKEKLIISWPEHVLPSSSKGGQLFFKSSWKMKFMSSGYEIDGGTEDDGW